MPLFRSEGDHPLRPRARVRGRLRRSLAALALPLLGLLGGSAGAAVGDPVVFSVFGDVPYRDSEIDDLEQHIANLNQYSPSAFLVHVGDILSGSEVCRETRYQTVSDILKTSEIPVFVLPGDNEWLGCSDPNQGWAWWEEHFLGIEENFCGVWPVESHADLPENFAFVRDGVLFIGLNYVSGSPSGVTQVAADWVNAQFAAHGGSARAAVIFAQKEAGGKLFDAVQARGRAFAKPVLYLHGNGHDWEIDPAYFGEPNMLRVQVERGRLAHPPVQVTVTSAGQFQFEQDPWPAGTPVVNRPPCGAEQPTLSIDDLFVTEGQAAVFTVSLSGATGAAASVGYATQNGTALAGSDYTSKSGTLSFSGSTTQRQVQISTTQDSTVENGESFFVNLTNPSGATVAKPQGAAVILDDDSEPPPPPPPGEGPVLEQTVTGTSSSASSVATSAPLSGGSAQLYLAAVAFKSHTAVTGVSGLGLSWSPVRQQCGGRSQTGIALFQARGSPGSGGIVTANLAEPASNAVIAVTRYSGTSGSGTIGNVVSANTNGSSGACSGGVDSTAYAVDLATGAANSLVFVAAAIRSKDHTPGAGFGEIVETYAGSGGSTAGVSLAERVVASAGNVGVNGSFDATVDWAVVAAEIRSGATAPAPVSLSVSTSGGGQVSVNPPGGSYAPGTTVTLTALPDPGYAFTGWSGALGGSANPIALLMDANKSVLASFGPASAQYSVTVQPATGGSVTLSPPGGVYAAGTLVTVTAVPTSGYRFGSWSGALSGTSNPTSLVVDANKTLGASFVRQYPVNVSTTGSGSVTLNPPGGLYDVGSVVTLTAVPGPGASFLGWSGALGGLANPTTIVVDASKSVTANFTTVYTLSTSTRGKGSVVLDPPGGSYSAGTVVTLTALPGSGFNFRDWSGDLSGSSNPATITMNADRSVTATFKK
jgi:hypothetical protein